MKVLNILMVHFWGKQYDKNYTVNAYFFNCKLVYNNYMYYMIGFCICFISYLQKYLDNHKLIVKTNMGSVITRI